MATKTTPGKRNKRGFGMGMSVELAESVFSWAYGFLIVALVVGVIATSGIVVSSSDKEAHLKRGIADANARAADAEARAAEAKLELERFRAPRLPNSEQLSSITEKIKPFAGTQFDTGLSSEDREQQDFLWRLEPAITAAGWFEVDWKGSSGFTFKRGDRPKSGPAAVIGVSIEIHPEQRDRLLPAAEALASALNDIGIEARAGGFNVHNTNPNAIHLLIGKKP